MGDGPNTKWERAFVWIWSTCRCCQSISDILPTVKKKIPASLHQSRFDPGTYCTVTLSPSPLANVERFWCTCIYCSLCQLTRVGQSVFSIDHDMWPIWWSTWHHHDFMVTVKINANQIHYENMTLKITLKNQSNAENQENKGVSFSVII